MGNLRNGPTGNAWKDYSVKGLLVGSGNGNESNQGKGIQMRLLDI